jgi:hypothetical protein
LNNSRPITQQKIDDATEKLIHDIVSGLSTDKKLAVIKAPPGSGKTYSLLEIVGRLIQKHDWQIAVAAQTNNQANDLAIQFSKNEMFSGLKVIRIGSNGSSAPKDFPSTIEWITSTRRIPEVPVLAIATTAKWAASPASTVFDLLAVDEAWQMAWADLMRCADLSERFMLIGDPGQIAPVTTIDVARWGTSLRAPHKAAPEVAFDDPQFESVRIVGNLPSCRRLPSEAVVYIKPFYDFDFDAYAVPGERKIFMKDDDLELLRLFERLKADEGSVAIAGWASEQAGADISQLLPKNALFEKAVSIGEDIAAATLVRRLSTCEPVLATIPTSPDGPPAQVDMELARAIHRIVKALLNPDVLIAFAPGMEPRPVEQRDIGVSASHRAMNGAIRKALGTGFAEVQIDTPERWQGLQKPIMIAVHPLSGVTDPSDFDLSTGRLCVMASRQQAAMIFVSRDHVGYTIENVIPSATQAPGEPDAVGQGRRAHLEFWELLKNNNRVVSMV